MMLNSYIFIFGLPLMRTPVDGPHDLSGVDLRVSWRAVHSNLAGIPIGLRTKQAAPMPHLPQSPLSRFGISDRRFDLLAGMPRP